MSDDFEDLTPRRHTMEGRVATLEAASDTHAVKIREHEDLLIAMKKDVSDVQAAFRAQLRVLNAVRETQSEQITLLRRHGTALAEMRTGQAKLHEGQVKLREGQVELRQGQVELRQGQVELRQGQVELREGLTETRAGIQTIIGLLPPADGGERPGVNSPN
jgi:hypothetical protein